MNVFGFCSALCDVLTVPALVCDGEGCILRMNRHARLLLRNYPEAVEGASWAALLFSLRPRHPLQAVPGAGGPSPCVPVQTVGLVRLPGGATGRCRITALRVPGGSARMTLVLLSEPGRAEAPTDPLLLVLDAHDRPAWLSSAARRHFGQTSPPCGPCPPGAAQAGLPELVEAEDEAVRAELRALRAGLVPSVRFRTGQPTGGEAVLWDLALLAGPGVEPMVAAAGRVVPAAAAHPQRPDQEWASTDLEPSDLSRTPPGRMLFRRTLEPGFSVVMLSGDCEAVTGYPARDLLPDGSRPYACIIAAGSRPALAEDLRAATKGHPLSTAYQILTPDGMAKWVHEQGWVARDPNGQPTALEGVITDMSRLTETEDGLRGNRDLYQSLFRAVPAGVIVEGTDGCILDANETACEVLQVPREAMLGREPYSSLWECVDEQERPVALEDLPSVRARLWGESVRGVVLGLRHHTWRDRRWLLLNAEPLPPASPGDRPRAIVAFTDITAQREALRALERSQSLAQRIIDTSPNLIYIHDLQQQRSVYANSQTRPVPEFGPGEPCESGQHHPDAIVDARDRAEIQRQRQRLLTGRSGPYVEFEYRLRSADGRCRLYQTRETVFSTTPDGQARQLVGTAQDVTDRRRAEEAVRRANDTAWALLNAHTDMALLVDAQGRILAANDAVARARGLRKGPELVGSSIADCQGGSAGLQLRLLSEAVATGEPVTHEGEQGGRCLAHRLCPVADDTGRVTQVAVFVQDVTDRKRAEDAARLAAVGQLAAGVVHDFNNLMVAMILAAEVATDLQTAEDGRRLADIVLRSASRGVEIGRSLVAFATPHEPTRVPLSLLAPLRDALATAARHIQKAGVRVVQQYQQRPLVILANSGQLEEVFLNILINACHAMPAGGTIAIEATEHSRDGVDTAVLSISDTGVGIAPEHLPHVFEPFFTTKGRVGESEIAGTGLGLSVAHRIVTAHGGRITAKSEVGRGTTFTIEVPLCPGEEAAPAIADEPAVPTPAAAEPGARILLVEDESDVAAALSRVLERDGHHVVTATSVGGALDALRDEAFDLVVADLMLPGGSGREVIARARALRPAPPVLVITGVAAEGLAHELRALGAAGHLPKPFGSDAFRAAVAGLLGTGEE